MMIMKLILKIIATALYIGALVLPEVILAQQEPLSTSLELTTVKSGKESRQFTATLSVDDGTGLPAGFELTVEFFGMTGEAERSLGSSVVDPKGKSVLLVHDLNDLTCDESGYYHFTARFEGNETYGPAEASLEVMDAWLELEFFEEDGERFIRYSGYYTAPDGAVTPIADQDVYLYTPRMFSMMKFEDGWLESEGEAVIEFPSGLIGDTLGNIEIVAQIEDHPDFSYVEASGSVDWAIAKHSEQAEGPSRELWTPIAPLWMIVTLIILLVGVWSHYFYAVYQLYMIRRSAKKASGST